MERFFKIPKDCEWGDDLECDDMLGPEEFLCKALPEIKRMLDMNLRRLQLPTSDKTRELLLGKIFPDFFAQVEFGTLTIGNQCASKVHSIQIGDYHRFIDHLCEPLIVPDKKDLNDAWASLDAEIGDVIYEKFEDLYEDGKISRLAVLRKAWVEDEDLAAIVGKEEEVRLVAIYRREGEMRQSEMMDMYAKQPYPNENADEDDADELF